MTNGINSISLEIELSIYVVDIPFLTKVRNEVVSADQALPHHILPDMGILK